jgi:hypothetical protein
MSSAPVMLCEKFSAEDLTGHNSLDLRAIGSKEWETIIASCSASEVRLYYLKIKSLAGIERLRKTQRLSIEYANRIENIAPVFEMVWLTKLFLSDLPRIRGIDGIEGLQELKELRLSGNRGSLNPPLRLASVRPIASLRRLEELEITNIRLEERDISFIPAAFPNLRSLRLSGKEFERAQFAFLAQRLNAQLEDPIPSSLELKGAPCRKCGGHLHVFMGRRMPMLCEFCDEKRFRKLTEEFQRA